MFNPKLLLVTASGLFGTNFNRYYKETIPVTRKEIDLTHFHTEVVKKYLKKCKLCLISAAITNIDYCETHPIEVTNLERGTIKFLKILLEEGVKPIFISTDYVFNGIKGNYKEDEIPDPINIYGKYKNNIEAFIRVVFQDYMIVRIGKQFSLRKGESNFLLQMAQEIKNGHTMVATDQIITPTLIDDTCKAIIKLINLNYNGIIHVCGASWSRMDVANIIIDLLQLNRNIISPIKTDQIGEAKRPPNSALCSDNFKSLTNFSFTPLVDSIQRSLKLCN